MDKLESLRRLSFGDPVAEDERSELPSYFLRTGLWNAVVEGEVDLVLGRKGAGKSALFAQLVGSREDLLTRGVAVIEAENPRGEAVFRGLTAARDLDEEELRSLWKLYLCVLLGRHLENSRARSQAARDLLSALRNEGLMPETWSLPRALRSVLDYVRRAGVEGSMELDPVTGQPKALKGKISFAEPGEQARQEGALAVDDLLRLADQAASEMRQTIWVAIDRLDVAFRDNNELEKKGLRALFTAYRDLSGLDHVSLKIFLRSDVWDILTAQKFTEASHVTRHRSIEWDEASLVNLIARRLLKNPHIVERLDLAPIKVLQSKAAQVQLLSMVLEPVVDRQAVARWLIEVTRDGTNRNAPRDIITTLSRARESQLGTLELGGEPPGGETLIGASALRAGAAVASEMRLKQTLFSEYPDTRYSMEPFRGKEPWCTLEALQELWGVSSEKAKKRAEILVWLGALQPPSKETRQRYGVARIYWPALELSY